MGPRRSGPSTSINATHPALQMLRGELGFRALDHLHDMSGLEFQDDPSRSHEYFSAALRIGISTAFEPAYGWAYYSLKYKKPVWHVYLFDEQGENQLVPKFRSKVYNRITAMRIAHGAFDYDDEFDQETVCTNTKMIRDMMLYYFLLYAEQEGLDFPDINEEWVVQWVERMGVLCERQRVENQREKERAKQVQRIQQQQEEGTSGSESMASDSDYLELPEFPVSVAEDSQDTTPAWPTGSKRDQRGVRRAKRDVWGQKHGTRTKQKAARGNTAKAGRNGTGNENTLATVDSISHRKGPKARKTRRKKVTQ